MKVTIVGGGNIGTQFMVHCAEKGHHVIAYTSKPEIFHKRLNIVDDSGSIIHEGEIDFATNDPAVAFRDADMILVTVPSMMMKSIAEVIYQNTSGNPLIGVIPGNGGSECAFYKCIERGNTFFGIERVPAVARLVVKGKTVKATGYREELHVSSLPEEEVERCCETIGLIFDMPCKPIPNFLNLTMTPSNPILHTSRLRTIFKDYKPGVVYKSLPLFYEEWDDASSELLIACDDEVQKICSALPEFQLSFVRSLKDHYESQTIDAMTRKISGILAFKGIATPSVEAGNGVIPDLHSRYFTADFSYGLTIIKQVADFAGVKTPNINEIIEWYKKIAIETKEFKYSDYGIYNRKDFEKFYLGK